MKWFSIFQMIILWGICLSCDSQQTSSSVNSATSSSTKPIKAENAIVFLFFTAEKKADGTELIKHTDTKITKGIAKNSSLDNKANAPGNIAVTFLGKDGNIISERIIEDPLNPMMESYSEEGINKEKMNFPKADFSIRFNQTGEIVSVLLEKINIQSKTPLITIKL